MQRAKSLLPRLRLVIKIQTPCLRFLQLALTRGYASKEAVRFLKNQSGRRVQYCNCCGGCGAGGRIEMVVVVAQWNLLVILVKEICLMMVMEVAIIKDDNVDT